MDENKKLAELLFPDITKTTDEYEALYPARTLKEGARVTRFAPSPTGFLHIGGLFAAMIAKLNADTTGGKFLLRIEDTDKKREIEDGVSEIIKGLKAFSVVPDEGVMGFGEECGDYGPYTQSLRREIYRTFAKSLVEKGLAYPCFCTEDGLSAIRDRQEAAGVNKGYYGEWAVCRDLTAEKIQENIEAGKPFVLRLRADGDENRRIAVDDIIRGKVEFPENVQDVILLKTDGIPTYHFAHAVDDHLMRTTHVIRGDEWLSSLPVHIALFKACGFKPPKYAHISPIMKEENGGKRKLSKRKDPEAAVTYYAEQGYPAECVLEYLLTLANSNFEDWRRANPNAKQSEFPFNMKKMSASGALFDLVKLHDVSKNVIAGMAVEDMLGKLLAWAAEYDPELYSLFDADREKLAALLAVDRVGCKKPRKDIGKWSEVRAYFSYMYDSLYEKDFTLPENIDPKDAAAILKAYSEIYSPEDDKEVWFEKIKSLCESFGFTPNVKEYKQKPDAFKGHVGDVSSIIRIAVTSRRNTPDLCSLMRILGGETVKNRITEAIAAFEEE